MGANLGFLMVSGAAGVLALLVVVYLARYVLSKPQGTDKMAQLSRSVQKGAAAFLKQEYLWVSGFVVVIALFLVFIGATKPELGLNYKTAIAFLAGAVASAAAGVLGMYIATRANARTAAAARKWWRTYRLGHRHFRWCGHGSGRSRYCAHRSGYRLLHVQRRPRHR